MKTAVTMISVGGMVRGGEMDIEGFIGYCSEIGVDGVDLTAYYWKNQAEEIKRIPALLRDRKLALPVYAIGNDFTVLDEKSKREQYDYVVTGIATAARLGAGMVRVFGGRPAPGLLRKESLELVIEALRPCVHYAAKRGITLAIENHGDMPGRSDELLEVVKRIDSKHLRINIDIANFYGENVEVKENAVTAVRKLMPYIAHVHVKDIARFPDDPSKLQGCILGEGIVPLDACLRLLHDAGYTGYLSLEFEGGDHYSELDGIARSIANLKDLLKKQGS